MKNKANGWIAVTDQLPEDFGDVLVVTTLPRITIGYYRQGLWNLMGNRHFDANAVTHWQHLPEPPK